MAACAYCDGNAVCLTPHGPVCKDHLEKPPPQLDRIEWMLAHGPAVREGEGGR